MAGIVNTPIPLSVLDWHANPPHIFVGNDPGHISGSTVTMSWTNDDGLTWHDWAPQPFVWPDR